MTDSRSHGSGNPSLRDSAMTPIKIEIAGTTVNVALVFTTLRNVALLNPSASARFHDRTIKNTD